MSAKEIGEKLVAYCREGRNMEAVEQLYADDAVSVEAMDVPGWSREVAGKDAIRAKNQQWGEVNEVHDASVKGPFPHGDDRFCVLFQFDVTNKQSGQRANMEEVALYTVSDGKIGREEFFYSM